MAWMSRGPSFFESPELEIRLQTVAGEAPDARLGISCAELVEARVSRFTLL